MSDDEMHAQKGTGRKIFKIFCGGNVDLVAAITLAVSLLCAVKAPSSPRNAKGAKSSKMVMFLQYQPVFLAPLAFLGELGGLTAQNRVTAYHDSRTNFLCINVLWLHIQNNIIRDWRRAIFIEIGVLRSLAVFGVLAFSLLLPTNM